MQVFEALTKRTRSDNVANKLTKVKDSALARRIWVDKVRHIAVNIAGRGDRLRGSLRGWSAAGLRYLWWCSLFVAVLLAMLLPW